MGYGGAPVTLKLPNPLDPATLDVWGAQLNEQGFTPLLTAINNIIGFINGDTTVPLPVVPPLVAISSPTADSTVTGYIKVTARVVSLNPIAAVSAYLGSDKIGDLSNTSGNAWSLTYDSRARADGTALLTVRISDTIGNIGVDSITVTISNPTPPPTSATGIQTETSEQLLTEGNDTLDLDDTPTSTSTSTSTGTTAGGTTSSTTSPANGGTTTPAAASLSTETGDDLTDESSNTLTYA